MKRWWIPVSWYLGITLLVPLLNGAGAGSEFWWHSAVVLAAVAPLALGASVAHACRRNRAMERALGGVVARSSPMGDRSPASGSGSCAMSTPLGE